MGNSHQRQISHLMRHTCDVYAPSHAKDASGRTVTTYPTKTIEGLPCNVQMPATTLLTEYLQRDVKLDLVLYHESAEAAESVTIEHRVVVGEKNFRVAGFKNDTQYGAWFRLDLVLDQT